MNDCLAATGSTVGLDPLLGALVLLLLGAGLAALAWRHRKRAAAGIALLPLALGVFLFSGLSGTPAQAAPCPPPAACTPTTVIESIAISGAEFDFYAEEGGIFPVFSLSDGGDELMAFYDAAEEAGATYGGVLTVANETGSVVFSFDEDGYVTAAVPALPADFTVGDIYSLIYSTLEPESGVVPAQFVISVYFNDGCADVSADATVTGDLFIGVD